MRISERTDISAACKDKNKNGEYAEVVHLLGFSFKAV